MDITGRMTRGRTRIVGFDQLAGIFWIERLTRLRRERALKRFAKLRAQQARAGA